MAVPEAMNTGQQGAAQEGLSCFGTVWVNNK